MTAKKSDKKAVLILGMHRSGTSAIARFVHMLGYDLGKHLMASREDNPRGFWENAEIIEFNENLMARMQARWDSLELNYDSAIEKQDMTSLHANIATILHNQFSAANIVIKDPRLCRLLPLWRPPLIKSGYTIYPVVVLRHPQEVALSLQKRDAMPLNRGLLLWMGYTLDMIHCLDGQDYKVVDYSRLMQPDTTALHELESICLLDQPVKAIIEEFSTEFLSSSLYHNKADEVLESALQNLACQIMELVRGGSPEDLKQLNLIREEVYPALRECHIGVAEPHPDVDAESEVGRTSETDSVAMDGLYNELSDSRAHAALMELERLESEEFVADLQNKLQISNDYVIGLEAELKEREAFADAYANSLAEKDTFIESLQSAIAEKQAHIDAITPSLDEKQQYIDSLKETVEEKEYHAQSLLHELEKTSDELEKRADYIDSLQQAIQQKDIHGESLTQELEARTEYLESLKIALDEKLQELEALQAQCQIYESEKQQLNELLNQSEQKLDALYQLKLVRLAKYIHKLD
jgi:hypothetical protein